MRDEFAVNRANTNMGHTTEAIERPKTAQPLASAARGRQSGRGALLSRVHILRQQADRLEALAMAIPENFPLDADAGLWEIVSRV